MAEGRRFNLGIVDEYRLINKQPQDEQPTTGGAVGGSRAKDCGNKKILAGTFYAYEMRQEGRKYYVVFTKGGELFQTYDKVFSAVPIKSPKWAGSLWDISDEAKRVNHFALLCGSHCKIIIADTCEGGVKSDVRDYMCIVDFLTKLQVKDMEVRKPSIEMPGPVLCNYLIRCNDRVLGW